MYLKGMEKTCNFKMGMDMTHVIVHITSQSVNACSDFFHSLDKYFLCEYKWSAFDLTKEHVINRIISFDLTKCEGGKHL